MKTLTGSARDFLQLLYDLQHKAEAQQQSISSRELDDRLALLRNWQSRRLEYTYADLLETAQYRSACRFFLEDIYAPRDFSQRDHDAERLYALLTRYLPEAMLRLLGDALCLNQLTARLDQQLARVLFEDLHINHEITPQAYAAAYRICDNYAERQEQIEMLARVLNEAAYGARGAVFALGLRLARLPAHYAGWVDLYGFLERGYQACKPMKNIDYFVSTIYQREMRILEGIFANETDPFCGFTIDD